MSHRGTENHWEIFRKNDDCSRGLASHTAQDASVLKEEREEINNTGDNGKLAGTGRTC